MVTVAAWRTMAPKGSDRLSRMVHALHKARVDWHLYSQRDLRVTLSEFDNVVVHCAILTMTCLRIVRAYHGIDGLFRVKKHLTRTAV